MKPDAIAVVVLIMGGIFAIGLPLRFYAQKQIVRLDAERARAAVKPDMMHLELQIDALREEVQSQRVTIARLERRLAELEQ